MSEDFDIKEQPLQLTASIRTRAKVQDLPEVIGRSYMAIIQYLNELGEPPVGVPFTAYYNMDMNDLDVEMGFPVANKIQEKDEIYSGEISAGKCVAAMHYGPYSEMEPTYEKIMKWINDKGYSMTGVSYEFYLNDPREVPEEKLETQIMIPVTGA